MFSGLSELPFASTCLIIASFVISKILRQKIERAEQLAE